MTAGERLVHLAGVGTAGALLLLIGSGATAGAALVNYSGLTTGTAAEHLLTEVRKARPQGGGRGSHKRIWLEEDGEILVFRSPADAATYLLAQKPNLSPVAKKKARKVSTPIRINIEAANAYLEHSGRVETVQQLIQTDWAFLSTLLKKIEEWEDDERLILLLVA